MHVYFPPLVEAEFLRRTSRFAVEVCISGRVETARLSNSGRLRTVLVPGTRVWITKKAGKKTKTSYELLLARKPGGSSLICLDAQLPPVIMHRALDFGDIGCLKDWTVIAREPRLGKSRVDLLIRNVTGQTAMVETKSVTLVTGQIALFPDAPTARGVRHISEIAKAGGGLLVFVVMRDDAKAIRINEPMDPALAKVAKRAAKYKQIEILAFGCEVSFEGIRLTRKLDLEWYDGKGSMVQLPDYLRPDMNLLFVGLNPGLYSAWYGMYFANPSNLFWHAFNRAGLIPEKTGPGEEAYLLRQYGIGFTDLVKRPTSAWVDIAAQEKREGAEVVRRKLLTYRPKTVCFVGISSAKFVLHRAVEPGLQPAPFLGCRVFVVPSTSPRQKAYSRREVLKYFEQLALLVKAF